MKPLPRQAVIDAHKRRRGLSPAQLIALSFALAIAVGTVLLSLPAAHAPGHSMGFLDLLFTATSAICVTGLIVVDTGTAFSPFGQVILLLLIQIGGLGILTFGTLLALASGRRIGFEQRLSLRTQISALQVGGVVRLIRNILLLTLLLELLGALPLYLRFALNQEPHKAAFSALFHSVSAFNNAGFSLFSDSLMSFAADPTIIMTVAVLVILGGLGFIVIADVVAHYRSSRRKMLSLHSKIVLFATAILLLLSTVILLALEWRNPQTLADLPFFDKLLAGFFQAVTPRTAGFNTLDYSDLSTASLLLTMLLMFIGANPGSTAGGIKTVTFFILLGSAWSLSRGRGELTVFGRRIAFELVIRAGVIALIAMMLLGAAVTALSISDADKSLLALAFEAVSAFGTVGLSLGITAEMSATGKIILMLLMYLGRIGPLTFALALVEQQARQNISYPAEEVVIG